MDGSGTWNYFSGVVSQITKERACRKDWREALVESGVYAFVRHLEFLGTYWLFSRLLLFHSTGSAWLVAQS